jgi:hypothetical protein
MVLEEWKKTPHSVFMDMSNGAVGVVVFSPVNNWVA